MVERMHTLEGLGSFMESGEPGEVLYDLGSGDKRTELLVTLIDGSSRISNRVTTSPLVKTYESNGQTRMDLLDSDDGDRYAYRNLAPTKAVFERPDHPGYELGDLVVNLGAGDTRKLTISQYYREE